MTRPNLPEHDKPSFGQGDTIPHANFEVDLARERRIGSAQDQSRSKNDQTALSNYGFPHLDRATGDQKPWREAQNAPQIAKPSGGRLRDWLDIPDEGDSHTDTPVAPSESVSKTDQLINLPRTANNPGGTIFVPHGFDKDKPAQVILLYHGYGTTGQDFLRDLKGQLKGVNSGPQQGNIMFVSVDWQRREGTSGSVDSPLEQKGWVARTLEAALAKEGMGLDKLNRTGIVSWSAGFEPTLKHVRDLKVNSPGIYKTLKDIALFDSHFFSGGSIDQWLNDNKKNTETSYLDVVNPNSHGGNGRFLVADMASEQARRLRSEIGHNVYYDNNPSRELSSEDLEKHRITFKVTNTGHYQMPIDYVLMAVKNMHNRSDREEVRGTR
jgi:hypothetical protein